MELACSSCSAKFRAAVPSPLTTPVRVICPSCRKQMVLRPARGAGGGGSGEVAKAPLRGRVAVVADEERPFRSFLGRELERLGFRIEFFDDGAEALTAIRSSRPHLAILNVYLKGTLGVEISEEIRRDPVLGHTKVVLIGALFRANRFRANPTNLYGADEYIEEQIPAVELQQIIHGLFPEVPGEDARHDGPEVDEARRLARLILSDIVIYNAEKTERGIREGTFFEILRAEISEGREYYEGRVSPRVSRRSEIFDETLGQFVRMKQDELVHMGQ